MESRNIILCKSSVNLLSCNILNNYQGYQGIFIPIENSRVVLECEKPWIPLIVCISSGKINSKVRLSYEKLLTNINLLTKEQKHETL